MEHPSETNKWKPLLDKWIGPDRLSLVDDDWTKKLGHALDSLPITKRTAQAKRLANNISKNWDNLSQQSFDVLTKMTSKEMIGCGIVSVMATTTTSNIVKVDEPNHWIESHLGGDWFRDC